MLRKCRQVVVLGSRPALIRDAAINMTDVSTLEQDTEYHDGVDNNVRVNFISGRPEMLLLGRVDDFINVPSVRKE